MIFKNSRYLCDRKFVYILKLCDGGWKRGLFFKRFFHSTSFQTFSQLYYGRYYPIKLTKQSPTITFNKKCKHIYVSNSLYQFYCFIINPPSNIISFPRQFKSVGGLSTYHLLQIKFSFLQSPYGFHLEFGTDLNVSNKLYISGKCCFVLPLLLRRSDTISDIFSNGAIVHIP